MEAVREIGASLERPERQTQGCAYRTDARLWAEVTRSSRYGRPFGSTGTRWSDAQCVIFTVIILLIYRMHSSLFVRTYRFRYVYPTEGAGL